MARTKKKVSKRNSVKNQSHQHQVSKKKNSEGPEGLFIPAGLLIGMGLGFLIGELVAGLFLGLGIGFLLAAAAIMMKKKK